MHEGQPDGQDAESVASIVRVRRPPIELIPEAAVTRPLTVPDNLLGNTQTSRMSPFLSNPSSQLSRAGSKRKSMREESEDFSFKDMMRMAMMQRQFDIEDCRREEKLRREHDKRLRRDDERLQREENRQKQQMVQQMFGMFFAMQEHRQPNTFPVSPPPTSNTNRTQFQTDNPANGDHENRLDNNEEQDKDRF